MTRCTAATLQSRPSRAALLRSPEGTSPSAPPGSDVTVVTMGTTLDALVRAAGGMDLPPAAQPAVWSWALRHDDERMRATIAACTDIHPDLRAHVAATRAPTVRKAYLARADVDSDELEAATTKERRGTVLAGAAANPNATADQQARWASLDKLPVAVALAARADLAAAAVADVFATLDAAAVHGRHPWTTTPTSEPLDPALAGLVAHTTTSAQIAAALTVRACAPDLARLVLCHSDVLDRASEARLVQLCVTSRCDQVGDPDVAHAVGLSLEALASRTSMTSHVRDAARDVAYPALVTQWPMWTHLSDRTLERLDLRHPDDRMRRARTSGDVDTLVSEACARWDRPLALALAANPALTPAQLRELLRLLPTEEICAVAARRAGEDDIVCVATLGSDVTIDAIADATGRAISDLVAAFAHLDTETPGGHGRDALRVALRSESMGWDDLVHCYVEDLDYFFASQVSGNPERTVTLLGALTDAVGADGLTTFWGFAGDDSFDGRLGTLVDMARLVSQP